MIDMSALTRQGGLFAKGVHFVRLSLNLFGYVHFRGRWRAYLHFPVAWQRNLRSWFDFHVYGQLCAIAFDLEGKCEACVIFLSTGVDMYKSASSYRFYSDFVCKLQLCRNFALSGAVRSEIEDIRHNFKKNSFGVAWTSRNFVQLRATSC